MGLKALLLRRVPRVGLSSSRGKLEQIRAASEGAAEEFAPFGRAPGICDGEQ